MRAGLFLERKLESQFTAKFKQALPHYAGAVGAQVLLDYLAQLTLFVREHNGHLMSSLDGHVIDYPRRFCESRSRIPAGLQLLW